MRITNFEQFRKVCPLSHEQVIERLVEHYFSSGTPKRRENTRANLDAIVLSTFKLSKQIGFAKMSMRDLHRECGLSLGGLYNYFESKESLALMIVEALHHIAFDWLPQLAEDNMEDSVRLAQLIRGHIYLSELLRPWFFFVFMESKNLPDENKEKARKVELDFQALLSSLYPHDSLIPAHLMAMMQDWHVKHWKYRNTSIDDFATSVLNIALASR